MNLIYFAENISILNYILVLKKSGTRNYVQIVTELNKHCFTWFDFCELHFLYFMKLSFLSVRQSEKDPFSFNRSARFAGCVTLGMQCPTPHPVAYHEGCTPVFEMIIFTLRTELKINEKS